MFSNEFIHVLIYTGSPNKILMFSLFWESVTLEIIPKHSIYASGNKHFSTSLSLMCIYLDFPHKWEPSLSCYIVLQTTSMAIDIRYHTYRSPSAGHAVPGSSCCRAGKSSQEKMAKSPPKTMPGLGHSLCTSHLTYSNTGWRHSENKIPCRTGSPKETSERSIQKWPLRALELTSELSLLSL